MAVQERNILGMKNIYSEGPKEGVSLVGLRSSGKPE